MINFGESKIDKIMFGELMISKVYYGESLVFETGGNYWITGTTVGANQQICFCPKYEEFTHLITSDNSGNFYYKFDYNFDSLYDLCAGCKNLKTIDLSNFNPPNIKLMCAMFYGCSNLEEVNLGKLDTSECTNITLMFLGCIKLKKLDLHNFNTQKVTNMSYMFAVNPNLQSLNLENFNTDKVTLMNMMFYGSSSISHIKCKQAFKDWCITNQEIISLPEAMREGGSGTWEIVD